MKRRTAFLSVAVLALVVIGFSSRFAAFHANLLPSDPRTKAYEIADANSDGTLSTREIRSAVVRSIMASASPNGNPMYDFDQSGGVTRQDVRDFVSAVRSVLQSPDLLPALSAKDTAMPLVEYAFIRESEVNGSPAYDLVIRSYNLVDAYNGRINRSLQVTSGQFEKTIPLLETTVEDSPVIGKAYVVPLENFQESATALPTLTLLDIDPITNAATPAASMSLRVRETADEFASETVWKPAECSQGAQGIWCSQAGASFASIDIPKKEMGEQYVATVRVKNGAGFQDYEVPLTFQSRNGLIGSGPETGGAYIEDNDCSFSEANTYFTLSRQSSTASEYMLGVGIDAIGAVTPHGNFYTQPWCMAGYANMINIPASNQDSFSMESFPSNKVDVAIVSIHKEPIAGYVPSKNPASIEMVSRDTTGAGNGLEYTDLNVQFPALQTPEGQYSYVMMDILGTQKKIGFTNGAPITDSVTFQNLLPNRSANELPASTYGRIIITEPLAPDAVGVGGSLVIDPQNNQPIIDRLLPEQIKYARTVTFADIEAVEMVTPQ